MIAIARPRRRTAKKPRWHAKFLAMLPAIHRQVSIAFRKLPPEAREEAIAEAIASSLVAFVRLVELGKQDIAFASPLARYAVAQVRSGRRVGASLNVRDISSLHCQNRRRLTLERLDRFDREAHGWQEILVEDRTAGPAEIAASRLDFAAWLRSLSRRRRRIATTLAIGETTASVARKFRVSAGRVSQLRRELQETWEAFVGEHSAATGAA